MSELSDAGLVAVRATVTLDGLNVGETAWVDPTLPVIQEMLRAQYLTPLPARLQRHSGQPQGDIG